ncbi:methylated-DNA--[protein]-cysteine S-methyltransferase [Allosphingosinicella humi]
MTGTRFASFDTAIGRCALIWRDAVVGAALPEPSEAALRRRIAARFPDAVEAPPTEPIAAAIDGVVRLLAGEAADLSFIAVDLSACADFERRVYAETCAIPPGEVRTYGEIAAALGTPGASRAVGAALGRNPVPIIVPCHRVVAADGRSGGFSAPGGAETKLRMLEIEGARRSPEPELFDRLPWATKPRS